MNLVFLFAFFFQVASPIFFVSFCFDSNVPLIQPLPNMLFQRERLISLSILLHVMQRAF